MYPVHMGNATFATRPRIQTSTLDKPQKKAEYDEHHSDMMCFKARNGEMELGRRVAIAYIYLYIFAEFEELL